MQLTAEARTQLGRTVKQLRAKGIIPAELYGRGLENIHLSVPAKEFAKVFKEAGENTVVELVVEGKKHPAMVHEVSRDYLTNEVSHVDFYQVRMDEKITAKIPLEFAGIAPGVRDKGGILNKTLSEIEVEALPGDLPHRLTVDIGALDDINKSLRVKDIGVPKGVRVLVDGEMAVATVTPPLKEEPKPEEATTAAPDLTAVKVETEEKKAERAKEKETGGEAGAQEKKQEKEKK
ncbi:MAG: 50S ribosomal protein L25 [Candidatus Liptonbacteria bacterium]|nr:50S ribosomal protein L25 [Candidatus Liptonbacteria bacterium]